MLEGSAAGRDVVWSLWQDSRGELQHKPLGLGSKTLPPSMNNYPPFEEQLLARYWVLCACMRSRSVAQSNSFVTP